METENPDSLNEEQELIDDSQTIDVEEGEPSQEDIAKLVETNKKLFARAKKAEQELKAHKDSSKTDKPVVESQPVSPDNDEEAIKNLLDIVDSRVKETLEGKEFDALELSDEAKKEIRTFAKANSMSAKDVVKTDFFKFLKQKDESKTIEEQASIGGRRTAPSKKDFSEINPAKDFDLRTEEGQKKYEEWKEWAKNQNN